MNHQWTPWGKQPQPANDNHRPPLMIGLTGLRNVGKSTVADLLVDEYGFFRVHAFGAGKKAATAWFNAMDMPGEDMVYGHLKDVPCAELPGGVSPRYFLERFGRFMGVDMGIEWTLGAEIRRAPTSGKPIVIESLVYEAPWFKAHGGIVWRIERPGHGGPVGIESDATQAAIEADITIPAKSVEELIESVRTEMASLKYAGVEMERMA